jgi:tetratricopeptide (TPR) repeat protein
MAKVHRNAPCPCGSGRKYKRCCLPADQEAARRRDEPVPAIPPPLPQVPVVEDDLTQLSNRVVDLLEEGRLDEAEQACHELKREFPDAIDWIERTGAVHEARGETNKAIEYYRRCLAYIDEHPDYFEEASKDWYRRSIERLEAEEATRRSEDGA